MKLKLILGGILIIASLFIFTASRENINNKTSVYSGASNLLLQVDGYGYGSRGKKNTAETVMHSTKYSSMSEYILALQNIKNKSRELQLLVDVLSETLTQPVQDQPGVIVVIMKKVNNIEYPQRICVSIYTDGPRCTDYQNLVKDTEELTKESVGDYVYIGFLGKLFGHKYNHTIDKEIRGGGVCGYVTTARSLRELGVISATEFSKDGKISYDFLKQVYDSQQPNNIGETFDNPHTQNRADIHENIAKAKGKSVICKNLIAPRLLPGETVKSAAAEKRLTEWCTMLNRSNVDYELLMSMTGLSPHSERIKSTRLKKVGEKLKCEVTTEDAFEQGTGESGTRFDPSDATQIPTTGGSNVYSVSTQGTGTIEKGQNPKDYYGDYIFVENSYCCELKK